MGFPGGSEVKVSAGNAGHLVKSLSQDFCLDFYSIFAWRIPWREEPGRLQSMGLLKVKVKSLSRV